jgi:hypothetical protein
MGRARRREEKSDVIKCRICMCSPDVEETGGDVGKFIRGKPTLRWYLVIHGERSNKESHCEISLL